MHFGECGLGFVVTKRSAPPSFTLPDTNTIGDAKGELVEKCDLNEKADGCERDDKWINCERSQPIVVTKEWMRTSAIHCERWQRVAV